jgi:hypothetical protein
MTKRDSSAKDHRRSAVESTSASLAEPAAPLFTLRKVVFQKGGVQEFTIRGRRGAFVNTR